MRDSLVRLFMPSILRTTAVLAGAVLLALVSIGVITTLQTHANASRDAQVKLAHVQTELNALQTFPWEADPQKGGSPALARKRMHDSEQRIEKTLAGLRRESSTAHLNTAAAPFRANVATLERVRALVAHGQLRRAGDLDRIAGRYQRVAARHLHLAGLEYRARASASLRQATFGSAAVILALVAAFGFFYRRSIRVRSSERANKAKSEFLSRMSHELRTPLNAILGFAQLLQMDELDPRRRENLEHILKGGRHLLDLIDEVLAISRIEAGTTTISLEPVHLDGAISEALDLVKPLAAERGIGLERRFAEAPERYVKADRQRLKQVLLNLLSNAIKYNREGGLVAVSLEQPSADRLRILVTDTGNGIAEDQMKKLFVPFERLGAERDTVEGTGLGLALSERLVELMGGTLAVESKLGVGSTFSVELALVNGPLEEALPGVPAGATPNETTRETRTILYVEDNLSNYELVEQILSGRPEIELLAAIQGNLALELAQQHRPALVLLDLHLPGMPGDEVLRHLKEDPRTRDIPVVVVSADATHGQIERLLEAGAHAYLTKPLDVRKFLEVVDEALAERVCA